VNLEKSAAMRPALPVAAILLAVLVVAAGCVEKEKEQPTDLPPVGISNIESGIVDFGGIFALDPLSVAPSLPPYTLPLSPPGIGNFDDFVSEVTLSTEAEEMLLANGFVVIKNPLFESGEDIQGAYDDLKERDIPIFVTTDSLLHLYHIQFGETLRRIEEDEFFADIWEITAALLDDAVETRQDASGDLKEALERNAAFLAVGLRLLEPAEDQVCAGMSYECNGWQTQFTEEEAVAFSAEVPSFTGETVASELALIAAAGGFEVSPIFRYPEDYSQYVPRGHYTRSEKLKNYFKALMWYGRMSFLLKEKLIESDNPARDADIQTMQAALLAAAFARDPALRQAWDRIYAVTSFYVGLSDDLTFYEYLEAMNAVFGSMFDPDDLGAGSVDALKAKLAEYRTPQIYGGTGNCTIDPPYTPEQADQCLEDTKGMRLMGQRFVPDSYVFSNLVGPYTGSFTGSGEPFTLVGSGAGSIRGFPRGLDIMAMLGSERAMAILEAAGDTDYEKYDEAFGALRDELDSFSETQWNGNLTMAWLGALRPLLEVFGEGYPSFMRSEAWLDKELVTALASWAEQRHDTILYAKQSYTMDASGETPGPPQATAGYVEPVPHFYNRLLALTRMTREGLDLMGVLDDTGRNRLSSLEALLGRTRDIAVKELEGEAVSEEDIEFLDDFPTILEGVLSEVREDALKTTLVADVHSDTNSGEVLEEGVGYIRLIIVAYSFPDGSVFLGAGPVLSYYEFRQPMDQRLTDEAWRDMLASAPPPVPEWTASFAAQ